MKSETKNPNKMRMAASQRVSQPKSLNKYFQTKHDLLFIYLLIRIYLFEIYCFENIFIFTVFKMINSV